MRRFGTITRLVLLLLAVAAGVFVFFAANRPVKAPASEPLVNTFDKSPTGFAFDYPAGWTYQIPFQGVLVAGLPESLNNTVPGPIFTVQRGLTMGIAESLSGAIQMYLQDGPLREAGRFVVTVPETDTTIDGRPARVIELEGAEPGDVPTHTRIIAVEADSSFIYLFIASAPLTQRDSYRQTFDAILDSVRLLE